MTIGAKALIPPFTHFPIDHRDGDAAVCASGIRLDGGDGGGGSERGIFFIKSLASLFV